MGAMVEYVRNTWPFSTFVFFNNNIDDLRASDRIVKKLSIPESTKPFVYAIREPELNAMIYILAVQNLSERSCLDAEVLIREVKPDAVVVQVGQLSESEMNELREVRVSLVDDGSRGGDNDNIVPTSVFEVLMNCFKHKSTRERYEEVAGSLMLREIFGVSFNGHLVSAKKAAQELGSSFLMLESPFVKLNTSSDSDVEGGDSDSGTHLRSAFTPQKRSMVPKRIGSSVASLSSRTFCVADEIQAQMVKSLSTYLVHENPPLKLEGVKPQADYEVPQFAKCVYPLLVDLHDIFANIPSIGKALACAQKLLSDVNKGEAIDNRLLSEVYAFQITVEGLRIALNNAGRLIKNPTLPQCEYSHLPMDDQANAILAQALRSQTKKYKSIVAVVDARGVSGLRRNWRTHVPLEIKDMVDQLVINLEEDDDEVSKERNNKWKLYEKPMVAVGAGATAVVGVSSFTKTIPASSLFKLATLNIPNSLQLAFSHTQKALIYALGKGSSLKGPAIKAAANAEKIRAVAHSVIASAEKTSLSAMRSAFYEIMRNRGARRVGVLPWATFGCSVATCAGLLVYGDGIECVAESVPAAPSIASLGRGIERLQLASQVVRPAERNRIQRSIESLVYRFKKLKIKIQ